MIPRTHKRYSDDKTGKTLVKFTDTLIKSGVVLPASLPFYACLEISRKKKLLRRLANAPQAKCILLQIPYLNDTVPNLLQHSRLGILPRWGFHWALPPALPCYSPGEWLHSAPWTVSFLWLCPLAVAFSPPHSPALRQASGLGPILLALSVGVTLS